MINRSETIPCFFRCGFAVAVMSALGSIADRLNDCFNRIGQVRVSVQYHRKLHQQVLRRFWFLSVVCDSR